MQIYLEIVTLEGFKLPPCTRLRFYKMRIDVPMFVGHEHYLIRSLV